MANRQFRAVWGRRVWAITLFVVGLCAALTVGAFLLAGGPEERWVGWSMMATTAAIVGGTGLFAIRGFEISGEEVRVRRVLWTDRIPLGDVESVEVDSRACEGAWKTIGNDGLFAMHGRFRSKRLGAFRAFVTNPEDAVVLRVAGRTVVLSPEDPRQFVHELERRRRRRAEGRP